MPALRLPEVTLVGRSNVGKSSALNTLAGRTKKKIAVVSKTPGRTRLINLFRVGDVCTMTDLPGYGFAKVSREMQDDWRKQIEGYLRRREELKLAVLFVDAQRDPQESDAQLLDFLEAEGTNTLGEPASHELATLPACLHARLNLADCTARSIGLHFGRALHSGGHQGRQTIQAEATGFAGDVEGVTRAASRSACRAL